MKDVRPKQHLTGGREGGDSAPLRGDAWYKLENPWKCLKSFVWGCSSPGRRLSLFWVGDGQTNKPQGGQYKASVWSSHLLCALFFRILCRGESHITLLSPTHPQHRSWLVSNIKVVVLPFICVQHFLGNERGDFLMHKKHIKNTSICYQNFFLHHLPSRKNHVQQGISGS